MEDNAQSAKSAKKKKQEQEDYVKSLEKHYDRSKDKKEYAMKQFDTLMVGISTAGIGFVTLYIKDMSTDLWLARIAQVTFVISLFANLASHFASMEANRRAEKIALDDLNAERYDIYPEGTNQDTFEEYQTGKNDENKKFNKIVKTLNFLSFILLLSAVVVFMIFAILHPPITTS